ncbi:MAG: hypothetical protein IIC90_00465, partial [Chloroflexi bacterium]|nr:hypothetical protein [Chloroflexota bacterium]
MNGQRLRLVPVNNATITVNLNQADLRSGTNTIVGITAVQQKNNDNTAYFRTTHSFDHQPAGPKSQPKLHYLGVGVTEFAQADKTKFSIGDLDWTTHDVDEIGHEL